MPYSFINFIVIFPSVKPYGGHIVHLYTWLVVTAVTTLIDVNVKALPCAITDYIEFGLVKNSEKMFFF